MVAFTEQNVEAVLAACSGNLAAVAESLNQRFDQTYRMEAGVSGIWSTTDVPAEFRGPGILALSQIESQGWAVLIPASLPLPEWFSSPSDRQKSLLESLAQELSANLLPADFAPQKSAAMAVSDLSAAIGEMAPAEWAATLELLVHDAEPIGAASAPAPQGAKLLIVWPLQQPNFVLGNAGQPAEAPARTNPANSESFPAAEEPKSVGPLAWLRHLPVQVSVRLAEKRMPMSQLMNISPGMLIPFNKSCEDLLDLYVNNSRYCRGEAVKIGENFGLKIDEVGVKSETQRKVIEA